jgi:hypothetical protein
MRDYRVTSEERKISQAIKTRRKKQDQITNKEKQRRKK